jgi:hypothetical protein
LSSIPIQGKVSGPGARMNANGITVFILLWVLTFAIYLPAIRAGWIIDTAGWLYNIRHLKFLDYINNKQSGLPSLYQFTQLVTWVLYKLFNANPYVWHTIMVTMHAINGLLLFLLFRQLFHDSGVKNGTSISLWGVILFTICPHISEVIVWEASFHYLQGLMLILCILLCLQKYLATQRKSYAWIAGILYFLSTYSLEIFYLTPWYSLALIFYYRYGLRYDKSLIRKAISGFFVPQILFFGLHIVVLLVVYNHFAHIAENVWQPFITYVSKPPFYIFHILFLGRFFSFETRKAVYDFLGLHVSLIIFYNVIILICCSLASRFNTMMGKGKVAVLLFVFIIISQVILLPLAFPDMLLFFFDRYTYFLDAFIYMLLATLVSYIGNALIGNSLLVVFSVINLYFTTKLNLIWKHATYIDNRLLNNLPDPGNKTVILLSMSENFKGAPMIGAQSIGEYKLMHELFVGPLPNKVYDVASFNMNDYEDGAHVTVINDSVIKVTLNQWGTWWWYEGHGGHSYENSDYRLNMRDMGHWYDITLKHPASNYLLLYQQGDQWKKVNMKKINEDQY